MRSLVVDVGMCLFLLHRIRPRWLRVRSLLWRRSR